VSAIFRFASASKIFCKSLRLVLLFRFSFLSRLAASRCRRSPFGLLLSLLSSLVSEANSMSSALELLATSVPLLSRPGLVPAATFGLDFLSAALVAARLLLPASWLSLIVALGSVLILYTPSL
jgi:hypothetical protein